MASTHLFSAPSATSRVLAAIAVSSLGLLAACGPSRLSDADVTRLCELSVRCSGGILTQASCEAGVEAQRDTLNMQGCGGQFGAVARCAIRADECGTPVDCEDEQMRLTTCMNRRDSGSGTTADAGVRLPDARVTCPSTSEEFGSSYCLDGCDNDGDGTYDCNDSSCCGSIECPSGSLCGGGSCEPASFEEGSAYCFDGCDNDGNGVYDCNDSGCCSVLAGSCASGTVCATPTCAPAEIEEESYCFDGCDNDGNGVYDCNDSGCCAALEGSCATGTLCGGASVDISLRTSSGWLEVLYMGEWRSICDDGFTMASANVACRQMGYSGASTYSTTTGSELFWLDDVVCSGTESSIADCSHGGWGYDNCSASECIYLVCF